jgi:hypothetical protein
MPATMPSLQAFRADRPSAARLKATRIERISNATSGLKSLYRQRTHTTLLNPRHTAMLHRAGRTMLPCSNTPSSFECSLLMQVNSITSRVTTTFASLFDNRRTSLELY